MTIAFRSATEAGTGSAVDNLVVSVPSGVVDDDLLLLFGVTADGDDGGFDALAGWTEIRDAAVFLTGGSALPDDGIVTQPIRSARALIERLDPGAEPAGPGDDDVGRGDRHQGHFSQVARALG